MRASRETKALLRHAICVFEGFGRSYGVRTKKGERMGRGLLATAIAVALLCAGAAAFMNSVSPGDPTANLLFTIGGFILIAMICTIVLTGVAFVIRDIYRSTIGRIKMTPNKFPESVLTWLSILLVIIGALGIGIDWFKDSYGEAPIHAGVFTAMCAIGMAGLAFLTWLKH
jgi:hypothetical protein